MHYIVLGGLVYCLPNEAYMTLQKAFTDFVIAHKNAEDEMDAYGEYSHWSNVCQWVRLNFKPVSIRSDNFDLNEHFSKTDINDLPF